MILHCVYFFQISFLKDEDCKVLGTKKYIPNDSISSMKLFVLKRGMRLNYQHHFIVGKCCGISLLVYYILKFN